MFTTDGGDAKKVWLAASEQERFASWLEQRNQIERLEAQLKRAQLHLARYELKEITERMEALEAQFAQRRGRREND